MNPLTLLALAAMTLVDPTGDAFGDGELTAPTSPVYANTAIFDLQELRLEPLGNGQAVAIDPEGALTTATVLRLTMGALDRGFETANGFSGLIVDVYLDTGEGGNELTLEGPGMALPAGRGWEYAVRLAPDLAYAVAAGATRAGPDIADDGAADALVEAAASAAEPARLPLPLQVEGNTLVVGLPWLLPQGTAAYVLAGVYDPFSPSGWRPLAATPSPWAFSGEEQRVPVVDLFAQSQASQQRALRSGEIAETRGPANGGLGGTLWLILMIAGVLVAGYGLWQRSRGTPAAPLTTGLPREPLTTGLPPEPLTTDLPREPLTTGLPQPPAGGPPAASSATGQPTIGRAGSVRPASGRPTAGGPATGLPGAPQADVPLATGLPERPPANGQPPEQAAVISVRPTAPPSRFRDAAALDDFFQADHEAERREAAAEDPAQLWGKRPAPLGLKVQTGEEISPGSGVEASAESGVEASAESGAEASEASGEGSSESSSIEPGEVETPVAAVNGAKIAEEGVADAGQEPIEAELPAAGADTDEAHEDEDETAGEKPA